MPVSLVKLSLVSFWMSTICGLPTISTLMDLESLPPPPPPPPAPAQPDNVSPATAGRASAMAIRFLDLILTLPSGWYARAGARGVVLGRTSGSYFWVVLGARPGPPGVRAPRTGAP